MKKLISKFWNTKVMIFVRKHWDTQAILVAIVLVIVLGALASLSRDNGPTLPPCGTGQPLDHCAPQKHPQNERWDQGYLSTIPRGCPEVVYFADDKGNLHQCPSY